jgi:hypothetical protein
MYGVSGTARNCRKYVEIIPLFRASLRDGFWRGPQGRYPTPEELEKGIENALKP